MLYLTIIIYTLIQGSNVLRAECKLLIFFLYFTLSNVFSYTLFMIGLKNVSQNEQGFIDYFACEVGGENPEDPCILEVDRQYQQLFFILF